METARYFFLFFLVVALALGVRIVSKAMGAKKRGEPFVFDALDGGSFMKGKEAKPETMLIVGGLYFAALVGVGAWVMFAL